MVLVQTFCYRCYTIYVLHILYILSFKNHWKKTTVILSYEVVGQSYNGLDPNLIGGAVVSGRVPERQVEVIDEQPQALAVLGAIRVAWIGESGTGIKFQISLRGDAIVSRCI